MERRAHGIYILPNSIVDDMFLLSLRSKKIIFSHETALFLNSLSDRTPFKHSLTIPSNAKLSKQLQNECKCFYIKPDLFEMRKIEMENTFGNIVNSYNAERTICDLVRSRNKIDEELFVSALKNYSASRSKNLHLLTEYSNKLGVKNILHRYLEVLL